MTPQEIFDKVWTHLNAQGVEAYSPEQGCMYRGPHDRKCAVGCLISDEEYSRGMEGQAVQEIVTEFPLPGWFLENQKLLCELQSAHDVELRQDGLENWQLAMRYIARRNGLTVPASA